MGASITTSDGERAAAAVASDAAAIVK